MNKFLEDERIQLEKEEEAKRLAEEGGEEVPPEWCDIQKIDFCFILAHNTHEIVADNVNSKTYRMISKKIERYTDCILERNED